MQKQSLLIVLSFFFTTHAFAWGSYGHEQVNRAAVMLLERSPAGQCFKQNMNMVQRLSITPDFDWKNLGTKPVSPDLVHLRASADNFEHPNHYFEADAFIKRPVTAGAIANLPTGSFDEAYKTLTQLFPANLDVIKAMNPVKLTETTPIKKIKDPTHPSAKEIAGANGSAPWRILQLYTLAQKALADHAWDKAFLYMGAMGHYVGDMGQPFHASLNYDGSYYFSPGSKTEWKFYDGVGNNFSPAAGIHHSFEEAILEEAYVQSLNDSDKTTVLQMLNAFCPGHTDPSGANAPAAGPAMAAAAATPASKAQACVDSHKRKANPNNDMWLKFDSTENAVLSMARRSNISPVGKDAVVTEVMKLISGGYADIEPLLYTFAVASTEEPKGSKNSPEKTEMEKDRAVASARVRRPLQAGGASGSTPATVAQAAASAPVRTIDVQAISDFKDARMIMTPPDLGKTTIASGTGQKVIEVAEQRMADSAVLLARLWEGLYESTGGKGCPTLPYNNLDDVAVYDSLVKLAITNYPYPDYITGLKVPAARQPQSVVTKVKKSKTSQK
jgi:hypothetical protein